MKRPDKFDFAMDFLGGDEEEEVRAYVDWLEAQRDSLSADIATLDQESRQMRARMERVEGERDRLLAACMAAQECSHQIDSWAMELINSAIAAVEQQGGAK